MIATKVYPMIFAYVCMSVFFVPDCLFIIYHYCYMNPLITLAAKHLLIFLAICCRLLFHFNIFIPLLKFGKKFLTLEMAYSTRGFSTEKFYKRFGFKILEDKSYLWNCCNEVDFISLRFFPLKMIPLTFTR